MSRTADLLANQTLQSLVADMQTLPSLPAVYQQLVDALYADNSSAEQVGRIIEKDLAMVGKILQVVNSPFYGLRQKVSSPRHAVALLGVVNVRSLVLSHNVFKQFDQSRLPFFSLDVLWQHGVTTANHARAIAVEEGTTGEVEEDAFTAGLLHDVGTLVIASNFPDRYTEVLALMQEREIVEWEAEREVLGVTHAEVGGFLLGKWALHDAVVEAVAFHHAPLPCADEGFTPLAAVHVANVLEEQDEAGHVSGFGPSVDDEYLAACGLSDRLPIWQALCRHTVA